MGCLKKLAVVVIFLCSVIAGCRDKDPIRTEAWGRAVEPRLTGSRWQRCTSSPATTSRIVPQAQCGAVQTSDEPCDEPIRDHAAAVRTLRMRPACTDAAIAALQKFARVHAEAMSDLSAAYYLRAQQEDRPEDLLDAYDAAERALEMKPGLRTALFNRALALEALGLSEAIEAWDAFQKAEGSDWGVEARERAAKIDAASRRDEKTTWDVNVAALSRALDAGDRAAVARLAGPYPTTAQRYLFDELLPRWAAAPTREHLARASLLGTQLSRRLGDPHAEDVVEAIARASPGQLAALLAGHRAFETARAAEVALRADQAAPLYEESARLFERGGSPAYLTALIGFAVNASFDLEARARALEVLERIEREARPRGYLHIAARARSTRAYYRFNDSQYLDALADYDAARDDYERIRDEEGLAIIQTRRIGVLYTVGQNREAWRASLSAGRHANRMVEIRARHLFLGETATVALRLGHPRVSLLYQDEAVRLIQSTLGRTPPEQLARIESLQANLAISRRARAGIALHLDDDESATRDIAEAFRLLRGEAAKRFENTLRAMRARAEEVRGQSLLRTDPNTAAAAFANALDLAADNEYRSWRASVRTQRADALRIAGREKDAEEELRKALDELRAEESRILAQRQRGQAESVWTSYFSRFRETYELLIRQLMDEQRTGEAFGIAERARAFEPLDLILKLDVTPPSFRRLISTDGTIGLPAIQRTLPADTFLLTYSVLEDRTYLWIVSRDHFESLTLPVHRTEIEQWSAAIQDAARRRNNLRLERGLTAPFEKLIAQPLELIEKRRRAGVPLRLVIVPDGAMHGLPFSALRNAKSGRFLVEDAIVSINGSATLYLFSLLRDAAWTQTQEPPVLLIGNPAFDQRLPLAKDLRPLRGAEAEVRGIAPLYGGAATVTGSEATVPHFLERAPSATIIHFAGHAIANSAVPSSSLLLLAPSPGHSGALEARELVEKLELDRTRLVVLSACSTAGGLPLGAEGVAPLVRSFVGSGVPAVVGTLWDVNDATPAEVLVSFHRHYRNGSDAAAAMQAAQTELLRGGKPVLTWAPFQVIGHGASPFAATPDTQRRKPP